MVTLNPSFIVLVLSILGIAIVIGRRIRIISAIPVEMLVYQESFLGFIKRRIKEFFEFFSRIKPFLMKVFEKNLLRIKILSLRLHNKIHAILEIIRSNKEIERAESDKKEEDKNLPE